MRTFCLIVLSISFFKFHAQKRDTPDHISVGSVKTGYFWNNDRNFKAYTLKTRIIKDSIKNGYFAPVEYLTFEDKKLVSIKYKKDGVIKIIDLPNGTGLLTFKDDTLRFENGKLNGISCGYSYHLQNPPPNIIPDLEMAKDKRRTVMNFENNFLKSMLVYQKGILIYESYYKKYDLVKESRGKTMNSGSYQDSVLNVFNSDGSLRSSFRYRNGRTVK